MEVGLADQSAYQHYRRNFDLHRAGGLWFWGVLLTLAVSGVYFNLNHEVFDLSSRSFRRSPQHLCAAQAQAPEAPIEPTLSFEEVAARARAEAARRGWPHSPDGVSYRPAYGIYVVDLLSSSMIIAPDSAHHFCTTMVGMAISLGITCQAKVRRATFSCACSSPYIAARSPACPGGSSSASPAW